MEEIHYDEILDYYYEFEDSGANSLREQLQSLLMTLWFETEGFSGKRPFGNSGWDYEMLGPLVALNIIDGYFDENGYLQDVDTTTGYSLITQLIYHIFENEK